MKICNTLSISFLCFIPDEFFYSECVWQTESKMILSKTDLWALITLYNLSLNVGRTRDLLLSIRIWQRQWDVISEIIFQKTITPFLLAYFPLLAWMKPVDMLRRLMWQGIESNLSQQAGGNRRWLLASNSQPTKTFSPIGFKDWVLPITTQTWKGFLPHLNLNMRLGHWWTPWL